MSRIGSVRLKKIGSGSDRIQIFLARIRIPFGAISDPTHTSSMKQHIFGAEGAENVFLHAAESFVGVC